MHTPAGHYYMTWIFLIPCVTYTVIISLMLNLVQESYVYLHLNLHPIGKLMRTVETLQKVTLNKRLDRYT